MRSTQTFFFNAQKQSTSMNSQPRSTIFSKRFIPSRLFISTTQFNFQSAEKIQLKNQCQFYRSQLKASLHLVESLFKICVQKQSLIKKLEQEIVFIKQNMFNLQTQKSNKKFSSLKDNQNFSGLLNISKITPNKKYSQEFLPQKMIISDKLPHETSQYKKLIAQKEESLKINKQENFYLRQKLLSITLKLAESQKAILQLKKSNVHLQKENHQLSTKLQQNQYCRVLNFSPISKISQKGADDEISFNQITFAEKQDEFNVLKQQVQQLQALVQKLSTERKNLQEKLQFVSTNDYDSLKLEYNQIKMQLNTKIEQISKYRQLESELSEIQKHSLNYLKENEFLKIYIRQLETNMNNKCQKNSQITVSEDKCQGCLLLTEKIEKLSLGLSEIQDKYVNLKRKIQKAVQIERNKRRQWNQFEADLVKNNLL